jgi:hypothetical protein
MKRIQLEILEVERDLLDTVRRIAFKTDKLTFNGGYVKNVPYPYTR